MTASAGGEATSRARDIGVLAGGVAMLVVGTTFVPYLFPPPHPITGASTALGFNNQVAYAWYAIAILLPGLALARLLPRPLECDGPEISRAFRTLSWPVLGVLVAAHVLFFGALFAYKGRFVFSEGIYFQALLHRMSLGEIPYIDFSYWYGPAMLYPAHWLGGIVGLESGYALWYVLNYTLGLLFVFLAVGAFVGPGMRAGRLSVFLAVALFNPMTGLNFTLARYLLPTIVFLLADDVIRRGGLVRWGLAAATLSFGLLYSVEVAALSVAAVLMLTALAVARAPISRALEWAGRILGTGAVGETLAGQRGFGPSDREGAARGLSLLVVAVALLVLAFAAIDPSMRAMAAYPDAAREDLSGAHNSPVYPHVPFLAVAVGTVFAIAGTFGVVTGTPLVRSAPALAAYLPLTLLAQRPSFSVSDPQHFLFFGLATLLLCLHLATRSPWRRKAVPALLGLLVVGLVMPQQAYQLTQLLPFFRGSTPTEVSPAPGTAASLKALSVEATLTDIAHRVGTDRPYFMYGLAYYSVLVHHRLGLGYASYDTDLNSVTTTEIVERLIGEIRDRNAVVVIERSQLESGERPFRSNGLANVLAWLTSAPMPGSELQSILFRNDALVQARLFQFLRTECRVILELNGFVALEPSPRALDERHGSDDSPTADRIAAFDGNWR